MGRSTPPVIAMLVYVHVAETLKVLVASLEQVFRKGRFKIEALTHRHRELMLSQLWNQSHCFSKMSPSCYTSAQTVTQR